MLNNKGFILYDALVSFILLSTTFMFFNQMILINSKNTIDTNIQLEGLNLIRKTINLELDYLEQDGFIISKKGDKYCAKHIKKTICL
mgnify:FL=1